MIATGKKVRVQVDLSETEAKLINHLTERLSVRCADLLQQAYGTFLWVLTERLSGNRIVSVDSENVEKLDRYKELSVPAAEPLLFNHYDHLVVRPESTYKQAYLRGRNMRGVGIDLHYAWKWLEHGGSCCGHGPACRTGARSPGLLPDQS